VSKPVLVVIVVRQVLPVLKDARVNVVKQDKEVLRVKRDIMVNRV
jgi:hypothetical protein